MTIQIIINVYKLSCGLFIQPLTELKNKKYDLNYNYVSLVTTRANFLLYNILIIYYYSTEL